MNNRKITVVINTFKSEDIITSCLNSIDKEFKVLIIENSNNKNFVGVGAVFEWVAGTKIKAPEWIADLGFEWILRLIQEPKRLFKRYLIDNILFIYYFLKQILK